MRLDGFDEISEVLRCGVYALAWKGVIVYVGKSKCMLQRVAAHKNLRGRKVPEWLPIQGLQFDRVFIRPCHPDRIDALEREMINLYKPKHNVLLKNGLPVGLPQTFLVAGVVVGRAQPEIVRRAL